MSSGAFRDASAALERVAMLEQENEQLNNELAEMAGLRVQIEELQKLREENETLRDAQRGENEGAFLKRLQEERIELTEEVRALRVRLVEQESALARLRRRLGTDVGSRLATFAERIERWLGKKPE